MSNKRSDKNVANIEIIENFIFELKSFGLNKDTLEVANELENLLSDYTRQKQLNEEHKKINGELRERVKELEEKNEHLSNTSDYETISLECVHLEEQLEIANSRIQELEIKLKCTKDLYDDCCKCLLNSIPKQVVKDKIEELMIQGNYKTFYNPNGRTHFLKEESDCKIEVLQELLEGEKNNENIKS